MKVAWVTFVCLLVVGSAMGARREEDSSAHLSSFTDAEDASLLGGGSSEELDATSLLAAASSAAEGDASTLDVTSLSALRDAITDDLSSDASLTDTLDRLLTGSEIDETVSGEAYGEESAHAASTPSPAAAESEATTEEAADTTPAPVTRSAVIPAPIAPATVVAAARPPAPAAAAPSAAADMHFKQNVETEADAADPVTPLKTHNTHVAVPVPGPLPGIKLVAHSKDGDSEEEGAEEDARKHSRAHSRHRSAHKQRRSHARASDDSEEEEEETDEATDKPRFLAERALNAAIASFSAQLTPQQIALASQGGTDPSVQSSTSSAPATSDRIKSAVYVVLAIGAVIAVVEACSTLTDYALRTANVPIDKMLAKTYKALMLLGLVSFLLVCFARLNWLRTTVGDYSPNLLFDLLIVMFVMGFLYLLVMCGLVGYVLYSVASYKAIEQKHRTEGDLNRLENAVNKQRDEYNARSCCTRTFASCFAAYHLRQIEFECHYLHIKQQFVRQHYRRFFAPYAVAAAASAVPAPAPGAAAPQPPSPAVAYQHFEFHLYLRKSMQQVMEEVAAVHWQVWCVIFAVVLLNALRMLAFKSVDAASFVYISVVAMWVVMLFALVLAFSMTGATEELAEHYSLYLPERDARDSSVALTAAGASAASAAAASAGEKESDDPDDELLREAHHIQGGGCCGRACACCSGCKTIGCCSAPTKQQELFWCKTPSSVTKGVQLAALLTCLVIPAYIVDMSDFVVTGSNGARYALNVALAIPPLLLMLALIPLVLPRFVLATSVASMSRLSALRHTVLKLNSTTYRLKKLEDSKAAKKPAGSSGGAAAAAAEPEDDLRSVMSSDDDDDSDLDNDAKSQDLESNYLPSRHATAVSMSHKARE